MYCVCQQKSTGELFVLTRKEREAYVSIFIDANQEIESFVVKTFDTMTESLQYIKNIRDVNDIITDL